MWNEVFTGNGISKNLQPTKAALIASLNLLIIHLSLSENKEEQNNMFQIESCAKQKISDS